MSDNGGIVIYSIYDNKPRPDGMKTFHIKQDGTVILLKSLDYETTKIYTLTIEAKVRENWERSIKTRHFRFRKNVGCLYLAS